MVTNLPMVMNHQSTTMVMVTNHRPTEAVTEATNPLKDQQQLLKKRAADMKASQRRKFLKTLLIIFITTIY
jgi:hypothetical protein